MQTNFLTLRSLEYFCVHMMRPLTCTLSLHNVSWLPATHYGHVKYAQIGNSAHGSRVQGILGTIPWTALVFLTLYLQLIGMSDFHAGALMALFLGGTALGSLLGAPTAATAVCDTPSWFASLSALLGSLRSTLS